MSYLVLARKWRPQRFEDVIGQRHVSLTLTNALKTGRLSHAYLFAGPRGIGKTTTARVLAKALNCQDGPTATPCNECDACRSITDGHCLDVLEIDGASNRGIDDVRQLRESVKYAPSSVRAKVYIIDEVHMLTTDAFNALLKTLEEPPSHVYFIMATTEPLKLPPTILSRCQRFDFGRVSSEDLRTHLRSIATSEGYQIDDDALLMLARKAEGGVRDSLTLLDQVAATGEGPFGVAEVQEILGLSGSALHFDLSEAVVEGDTRRALALLGEAYQSGLNLQEVSEELVHHFRNLMFLSVAEDLGELIELTADELARLKTQAGSVRPADALRWLRILLDVAAHMRRSAHARIHLEVALAEMASLPRAVDLGQVLKKLQSTPSAAPPTSPADPRRDVGNPPASRPRARGGKRSSEPPPAGGRSERPPAAGAQPSAGAGAPQTMDVSALSQVWHQIVERTRTEKAFLGSCLCDSKVVGIRQGRVQIFLDDANGFKRDQVEKPSNRRFILRAMEELLGRPLGIQVVKDTRPPDQGSAPSPAAGEARPSYGSPPPATRQSGPPRSTPPPQTAEPQNPTRTDAKRIADLMDGDIIGPAI